MSTFIYDLSDPRTGCVRYIGKSVNPVERLATHIREAKNGSIVHCKRWISGLLIDGLKPVLGIIEEVPNDLANDAERYWIGCLRLSGADLTNQTPGGDGQSPSYRPSKSSVEAGAAKRRGKRISESHRAAMVEAFNRPEVRAQRREITLKRMSDPVQREIAKRGPLGMKMTKEAKEKISRSWTPERKAAHAAEKSALPVDDRWREQLSAALKTRWDKYRAAKQGGPDAG